MDFGFGDILGHASVAFVTVDMQWLPAGDLLHLMKRILQGVPVKRIAVKGVNRQYPVVPGTADHRHLTAKLVLLVNLALGNTFHFRGQLDIGD